MSDRVATARQARKRQLADQIDPDRRLPPAELEERVAALQGQHLRRAALLSSATRKRRVAARYIEEAEAAEQEAEQLAQAAS